MKIKNNSADLIPVIKRARGYRLYTEKGDKILDFCQDGGRSVLGYTPPGFSLSLKQEISKGTYSSLPSRSGPRVIKALQMLAGVSLSGAGVFSSAEKALLSISSAEGREYNLINPLFSNNQPEDVKDKVVLWYPFGSSSLSSNLSLYKYVLPVIPFPGSFAPYTVISAGSCDDSLLENVIEVSGIQLAGLIRCISLLIKYMKTDPYSFWDLDKEKLSRLWIKKGPYLVPVYPPEKHDKIFRSFLKKKILISLSYEAPGALPGEISAGEKADFLKTVEKVSEEIS